MICEGMNTNSEAGARFGVCKDAGVSSDNVELPLDQIDKKDVEMSDVIEIKDSFDTSASREQGSIFDTEVIIIVN